MHAYIGGLGDIGRYWQLAVGWEEKAYFDPWIAVWDGVMAENIGLGGPHSRDSAQTAT